MSRYIRNFKVYFVKLYICVQILCLFSGHSIVVRLLEMQTSIACKEYNIPPNPHFKHSSQRALDSFSLLSLFKNDCHFTSFAIIMNGSTLLLFMHTIDGNGG